MRKKALAIFLALTMIILMLPTAAFASQFSDMPNDVSKTAFENAVNNGLLQGVNGKIMPNGILARAQMAAIINRAFGATEKADISNFKDVAAGKWYTEDMAKAVRMGTFKGSGSKLDPEKAISRQDAFTVLARAFKLTATDLSSLDIFSDKDQISSYAKGSIAALTTAGYLVGIEKINPKAKITRTEFVTVINRMVSNYFTTAGTYTTVDMGNVMINKGNVILKGLAITGDLIIGDGTGKDSVTLDNVKVSGRVLVRGGGANSIHVINGCSITGMVMVDNVNNQVRIVTDKSTTIQNIGTSSPVILEGEFGTINVTGDGGVEVKGNVRTLAIKSNANVTLTSGTIVNVNIDSGALGATLNVAGATLTTLKVAAKAMGSRDR